MSEGVRVCGLEGLRVVGGPFGNEGLLIPMHHCDRGDSCHKPFTPFVWCATPLSCSDFKSFPG